LGKRIEFGVLKPQPGVKRSP